MPGRPGSGGTPPKPSSQRRRRNKPAIEETTVEAEETVRGPALKGRHSAMARRWWEALRRSGQAALFEPSDWSAAELVVVAIDAFAKEPRASMLAAINAAQSGLLVSVGDRRRLRVELEHPEVDENAEDAKIARLADYARRFSG